MLVFVLCLQGEDATLGVRLRHRVKQDMARRGAAAIDDQFIDGLLDAKGLEELLCLRLDLFPSGVQVPASKNEPVPVYLQVHGCRMCSWNIGTWAGGRQSACSRGILWGEGGPGGRGCRGHTLA